MVFSTGLSRQIGKSMLALPCVSRKRPITGTGFHCLYWPAMNDIRAEADGPCGWTSRYACLSESMVGEEISWNSVRNARWQLRRGGPKAPEREELRIRSLSLTFALTISQSAIKIKHTCASIVTLPVSPGVAAL